MKYYFSIILFVIYLGGIRFGGKIEFLLHTSILVLIVIERLTRVVSVPTTIPLVHSKQPTKPIAPRTDKDLQHEILSLCRKIATESEIFESIFNHIESRYNDLNIIHACTIYQRLSTMKCLSNLEIPKNFVALSCRLIESETSNFKTACILIKLMSKLLDRRDSEQFGFSVLKFIRTIADSPKSDLIDNSAYFQLVQIISELIPEDSISICHELVSQKISSLSHSQFSWFTTSKLFSSKLIDLVDKFEIFGFHQVYQFIREHHPESLAIVVGKLHINLPDDAQPYIADLVAATQAIPTNQSLIKLLMRNFFEINISSIITFFIGRSAIIKLSADHLAMLRDSVTEHLEDKFDSECNVARKKLSLALRILAFRGIILDNESICKQLKSFCTELGEELTNTIIVNYGFSDSAVTSKAAVSSWRFIDMYYLLPRRFLADVDPIPPLPSDTPSCETKTLLALYPYMLSLRKNNRKKIERFVPHNIVDAINLLISIGSSHERFSAITNGFVIAEGEDRGDGLILTCIRALKEPVRSSLSRNCTAGIEKILCLSIEIVPDTYLADVLEVVEDGVRIEVVVEELCRRLGGQGFHIRDVTYLIDLFAKARVSMSKPVEDKLFQAIQAWIVPRVHKFSLTDIQMITTALECYTSGGAGDLSPAGSVTCIDTPVGVGY